MTLANDLLLCEWDYLRSRMWVFTVVSFDDSARQTSVSFDDSARQTSVSFDDSACQTSGRYVPCVDFSFGVCINRGPWLVILHRKFDVYWVEDVLVPGDRPVASSRQMWWWRLLPGDGLGFGRAREIAILDPI